MKKFLSVLTILMILVLSLSSFSVSAKETKGKSVTITFESPEAAFALAEAQSLTPADYQIRVVDWGGVWDTGAVGYDETQKLVYATSKEGAASNAATRVRIIASSEDKMISGEVYQYARVQYKLEADMPAGTTYTTQIRDAAWYYAPVNSTCVPNEWYDDPVDLRTLVAWMNKGTYDIGDGDTRENVGGGLGADIATNAFMFQVEAQGDLLNSKLYIKSITFYENREDAFGAEEEENASSEPEQSALQDEQVSSSTTSIASSPSSLSQPSGGTKPPSYLKDEPVISTGLLIGLIAGAVVLVVAVIVILIVVKKKKARTVSEGTTQQDHTSEE